MARDQYMRQVDLLVRTLPFIARHEAFALKGGTAINLFYRDMPRLSVDIDLTYLPIEDRETTLKNIDTTLEHIREDLMGNLRGVNVQRIAGGGNNDTRLLVRQGIAEIKVETSPVARGTVHSPERRRVSAAVEDKFGFAEMQVVSFEDLFGGKLHAAVDRQHPRDLFDVKMLYENEGLTAARACASVARRPRRGLREGIRGDDDRTRRPRRPESREKPDDRGYSLKAGRQCDAFPAVAPRRRTGLRSHRAAKSRRATGRPLEAPKFAEVEGAKPYQTRRAAAGDRGDYLGDSQGVRRRQELMEWMPPPDGIAMCQSDVRQNVT